MRPDPDESPRDPADEARRAVLAAFEIALELDAAEGALRPLEEYLAAYPGHDSVIRNAWQRRVAARAEAAAISGEGAAPSGDGVEGAEGGAVLAFTAAYRADRAAGDVHPLHEYLARFDAGNGAVALAIAERYAALDADRLPETALAAAPGNGMEAAVGSALDADDLAPGVTLGPFRIERLLGSGGQGSVYRAFDERLRRAVALKVLAARGARGEATLRRFRREALAASRLAHPAICTMLDTGRAGALAWLAMTFVEGESLAARIATVRARGAAGAVDVIGALATDSTSAGGGAAGHRPVPFARTLALVEEVARALHVAHEAGIVHRDVKPGNVMVTTGERPVLLDFGLARDDSSDDAGLTLSGDVLGTPAYMAPEQIEGGRGSVDRRTDVYALGVLLYECVTLRRPFEAATTAGLYREILHGVAADPRRLCPAVGRDLATVVATAMERDPDRRYPTALAMAEDLARVQRREPIAARPVGAAVRVRRWAERNPLVATAAVVLALGAAATVAWTQVKNAELREVYAEARWLADAKLVEAMDGAMLRVPTARPEDVPGVVAWLARAEALAARLPEHRARLEGLRAEALPYGEAEAEQDRATHPRADERGGVERYLSSLRQRRERTGSDADRAAVDAQIAGVEAQLAALTRILSERRTWRFADPDRQWEHDTLATLVQRLSVFVAPPRGTLPKMREALAQLRTLRHDTVDGQAAAAAWAQAAAEVAADARFRGLRLEPQVGLWPLGPDPESRLQEFAHVRSGAAPRRDADGHLLLDDDSAIVLVLLPGGRVRMGAEPPAGGGEPGAPHVDPRAGRLEGPVHEVGLAPFFFAKHELTQGQYLRLRGDNPSLYPAGDEVGGRRMTLRNPAENLSWFTCDELLRMVGLSLPTEAQWEYGARAGTTTPWWTGAERETLRGAANLADRSILRTGVRLPAVDDWPELDDGWATHAPVGSYRANPFGLHDVHGNVSEWCADPLLSYAKYAPRAGDGLRWTPAPPNMFVTRGGCFGDAAVELRCASRGHSDRGSHSNALGVRPARALDRAR